MSRFRPPAPRRRSALVAATLVAVLGVLACQDESSEGEDIARLAAKKQEILRLVQDAVCKEPADCATIGFGAKPCGGPWEYLVYSKSSVDEEVLKELVARYNEFNDVLNRRYGWSSTCDVAIRPEVSCVDGRCVGVAPGRAGR